MPTDLLSPLAEIETLPNQIELELDDYSLAVDRDRIRIGSSPLCEIVLPDGPLLHSVIHFEEGVLWVERYDETAELLVNWRLCRRMALRNGDVISLSGVDITVRHPAQIMVEDAVRLVGDLKKLTADELCDRILAEQAAVDEFETNRQFAWQNLMAAIQEVAETGSLADPVEVTAVVNSDEDCERLLDQIRDISDLVNGHAQQLDQTENDLVAATSLLQETQDRVSQQIEDLLDQIGESAPSNELRVSA